MIVPLHRLWDRSNRIPVLIVSGVLIATIALADWWTAPYLSLGFLYLFPIMLAAGFLPRLALLALGILGAVLSEAFSSLDPAWRVSRLIFETLALAGCGLFVSEVLRNHRLSLETQTRLRTLVETSPAAIVILDRYGVIELANQAAFDLMAPSGGNLPGQAIATFLPELQNALRSGKEAQFRTSMQCQAHRGSGETFVAEVWFSTYKEGGSPKLAAIVADVTEEHASVDSREEAQSSHVDRATLNARQVAVLRLVFEGLSNNDIASRLEITPSAVKNTLQSLFSKLGVSNRSQMVRVALESYRDLL